MNIYIRVDASIDIGSGHVMRCITLAKQLDSNNFNVVFICREADGDLEELIISEGFIVKLLPKIEVNIWKWMKVNAIKDALETLEVINNEPVHLLVVDHYGIDQSWEKQFLNTKIMVIDDLANRKHFCDVLLDQNYYVNSRDRYKAIVQKKTILCLGPKYALLRDEFFQEYKKNKMLSIFIFFGASDLLNETMKCINALLYLNKKYTFHVVLVVGEQNPNKEELQKSIKNLKSYEFHCQVKNIAELMSKCHFSITAGGTITWERAALGLAGGVIVVADNQLKLTESLVSENATGYIGESKDVDEFDIINFVQNVIENPKLLLDWTGNINRIVQVKEKENLPIIQVINEVLFDAKY